VAPGIDLPLEQGESRLLLKVASPCGTHGFAPAIRELEFYDLSGDGT